MLYYQRVQRLLKQYLPPPLANLTVDLVKDLYWDCPCYYCQTRGLLQIVVPGHVTYTIQLFADGVSRPVKPECNSDVILLQDVQPEWVHVSSDIQSLGKCSQSVHLISYGPAFRQLYIKINLDGSTPLPDSKQTNVLASISPENATLLLSKVYEPICQQLYHHWLTLNTDEWQSFKQFKSEKVAPLLRAEEERYALPITLRSFVVKDTNGAQPVNLAFHEDKRLCKHVIIKVPGCFRGTPWTPFQLDVYALEFSAISPEVQNNSNNASL